MERTPRRRVQGFALTTSLVVVAIVAALIAGTIFTTQFETNVALNDAAAAQAQYVAEAGLQKYKAVLFQAFRYNELNGGGLGFACENSLSNGIDFFRDGAITPWVNDRIVRPSEDVVDVAGNVIGSYEVTLARDPGNDSRVTVISDGKNAAAQGWRRATAHASATFIVRNSAGVDQAVFAGTGHAMKFFNGNTEVYGGVHIVGDKDSPNSVVIDTSGNSRILNGYDTGDTGDTSSFLVPEAQEADNLCAAVRVQYGRVAVGGNANFGASANPLLTVAIGDEPGDLIATGTDCDAKKMHVCAHSVGLFDLWESPPVFPLLDVSPGTQGCPTTTWRTCIRQEADDDGMTLALTAEGASTVALTGALATAGATLPAACQAALNGAAAGTENALALGSTSLDCTVDVGGTRYGFQYQAGNPATFDTFGNVNIRGLTVQFDGNVHYRALSRSSTGSQQDFASLSVESVGADGGDFIAKADFVTASAQKFPENVLSVVAERDVKLLGGNSDYTLPAYAGGAFMTASGSRLFGQAIADTFCTVQPSGKSTLACSDKGGSPAQIFYVPTGSNRAKSFNAISPIGGLPTFRVEAYEVR